ncbi:group 1 truncated hemoglobin [Streptomyces tanashiensis]|uniref:group I truncated hemoglobin n=1 Tax=Streptomyces tanashiensis TaxID=67367 RepID=UPI0036EB6B46
MTTTETASLFDRLGGLKNIYAFCCVSMKHAIEHPAIGEFWQHATEAMIKEETLHLVDFLASRWGGPDAYRGKDMVTTHRGMGVTDEHWTAIFEAMETTYEEFGLPQELRDEINADLQKLKPAIVGSPAYRDVILEHPEIDIMKGMKSVGVIWPPPSSQR